MSGRWRTLWPDGLLLFREKKKRKEAMLRGRLNKVGETKHRKRKKTKASRGGIKALVAWLWGRHARMTLGQTSCVRYFVYVLHGTRTLYLQNWFLFLVFLNAKCASLIAFSSFFFLFNEKIVTERTSGTIDMK